MLAIRGVCAAPADPHGVTLHHAGALGARRSGPRRLATHRWAAGRHQGTHGGRPRRTRTYHPRDLDRRRRRSTPSARCSSGWPRTYWISHPLSSAREAWSSRIQELNGTDLLVSAAEWQEHSRFAPEAPGFLREHIMMPGTGTALTNTMNVHLLGPLHLVAPLAAAANLDTAQADPRNRRAADLTTDERSNRVGEVRRIPPLRGRGLTLLKLKPGRRRWRFTRAFTLPRCASPLLLPLRKRVTTRIPHASVSRHATTFDSYTGIDVTSSCSRWTFSTQ